MKTRKSDLLRFSVMTLFAVCFNISIFAQTVTDIDGKSYVTVKIGTKEWMTQNLDVAHFRNGDSIPQARTPEEWKEAAVAGKPVWCYYNNSDSIGRLHGKLYNWYAIIDTRGLAPEGWHIPSTSDWTATSKYLGGVDVAGIKMKDKTGWDKRGTGSNQSRFTGRPGGTRLETGEFTGINEFGQWWSVSETVSNKSLVHSMKLQNFYVEVFYQTREKGGGLSVRAVRN